MSASEQRQSSNGTVQNMKVIRSERSITQYPHHLDPRIPKRRAVQVRPEGFLGWGHNKQDISHEYRLTEEQYILEETDYALLGAVAVEGRSIKAIGEGLHGAEERAEELPPGSVARSVADELVVQMGARCSARHSRYTQNMDIGILNVLDRG